MRIRNIYKQFKRNIVHKYYVAYYCFQLGLYWQGIKHDMSKFTWKEFSRSVKYWHDDISSLANERKLNGYSETFLFHRGRNPHHYEFWIYALDRGGIPAKMPKKYMLELVCDYLAACKTYGGNPKEEYKWFDKNKDKIKMNDETKEVVSLIFYNFSSSSLKAAVKNALNTVNY